MYIYIYIWYDIRYIDKRTYICIYIYIGIDKVSHRLLHGYIDLVSVYKLLSSWYLYQPSTNRSRWGVGTYRYMAPEVVRYEQYTAPGHVGGWHQHLGCSIHGTPKMYGLYWKIFHCWWTQWQDGESRCYHHCILMSYTIYTFTHHLRYISLWMISIPS